MSANNMKTRYGVEEENKTKEQDDYEENEDKEAQNLSNEEEKRHDEQMKKSKKRGRKAEDDDDKDEINIDTGSEDEDKEDAEDSDKLDLTDKQKEFLRDSRLAKQVAILKAEVKSLKAHIRTAKLEPIINSILEAKSKLGKINADAEYAKLIRLDSSTLQSLKADYDQLSDSQNQPRYQVKYASVENSSGDDIFTKMRGEFN